MRVTVVGAGATGGYLAGKLSMADNEVSVVDVGLHLAAIREQGLRVKSHGGDFTVRIEATDDPAQLGSLRHGRFTTNHFTLKCPFPAGVMLPETRRVTVSAELVDFLTGATLTAVKEVTITVPSD